MLVTHAPGWAGAHGTGRGVYRSETNAKDLLLSFFLKWFMNISSPYPSVDSFHSLSQVFFLSFLFLLLLLLWLAMAVGNLLVGNDVWNAQPRLAFAFAWSYHQSLCYAPSSSGRTDGQTDGRVCCVCVRSSHNTTQLVSEIVAKS